MKLLAGAMLAGGCDGPGFGIGTGEYPVPRQFHSAAPSQPLDRGADKWWLGFQDPVLNELVEVGLSDNLDVRKAVARIKQAEGVLAAAGYPFSGTVRVGEAKYNADDGGTRSTTGFARAEASWRIDLFDELENEKQAAQANLDAAYDDADIARLTLLTDLVSAYIDLRYAQELLRINNRVSQTRQVTLNETEKLEKEGQADEIAVAQATALLASSRAQRPEAQIVFAQSVNRVIALAGSTDVPQKGDIDKTAPQPLPVSSAVQTGVPADLVRNRPDIRRAEQRLLSALYTVGATEAELYTGLILTGNITANLNSSGPNINAGFFRVGLDVPWFDRPVRKGRLRAAQGVAEERRAEWEKQVVFAIEEVRSAMYALDRHKLAIEQSTKVREAAQEVLDLSRKKFAGGSVSFLAVQDAERSFLDAENALALDKRNYALDFVTLHVALGGRFTPPPKPAEA